MSETGRRQRYERGLKLARRMDLKSELHYLGQMLSATIPNESARLSAIIDRLTEIRSDGMSYLDKPLAKKGE